MTLKSNYKILLTFFLGIIIGIFGYKNFGEEKNISDDALNKIECPKVEQTTQPGVCPSPTTQGESQKPEEEIPAPIVKLEDGTFPAPQYTNDMPEVFETKHPGEFKVVWEKVPGVTLYKIRLLDKKGNSIRSYTTNKNLVYIQKIPWDGSDDPYAMYKIYVASLNEANQEGPRSEIRKVKLYKDHAFFGTPEKVSPLVAPEIKSITTED